ncbi:MAG: tRNA-dihydrouridine synthase [Clostridia bacterium]|nr:tRNA-dihydrouridine synthase [Clostridia bacterium]
MTLKIGDVELKSNLLFAPIAGFSEVGYRHLCMKYGAGLTYTELVSAKGLCYGNKGSEELLATTDTTTPCAVQLFGSDPEFMFKAAKDERLKKFALIDINMGCPVKKVYNNGEGSALMNNPALITELVQAVREGSGKPVTCKMRAGVEMGKPIAVECALAAEKGGAAAVTIHPRYREQFYSGTADHSITRAVKEAVRIPVIANGDIYDKTSLERVRQETGADGFMLARGALGRPYIFAELDGRPYEYSRRAAILEHIGILREYFPDLTVANIMKLHLCYYARGEKFAKQVRVAVGEVKGIDDLFAVVDRFFC